jgi:anhydro-N-acetylmuramic acid kinase
MTMRVIGLISGTSFDGIEAAAADFELDGEDLRCTVLGAESRPYPEEVRERIAAALPPAVTTLEAACRLDSMIGQAFGEVAAGVVASICGGRADLVCSHGQTVYHWVEQGRALGTLQLGQPAWIAERCGLPVVSDTRARDITVGGQGAPLVSLLDVLLLGTPVSAARAALNLGGIANLTAVRPGLPPIAYDTGPANALIDAAVQHLTGGEERYDRDGRHAARGRVDRELLGLLLEEPYYRLAPPKSTGKELFHLGYLREQIGERHIPDDDLIATVTALTVESVAREVERLRITELYASGGGTRNPTLMTWLERRLPGVRLGSSGDLGVPEAAKEALAFALIGFFSAHGLPGTVPACTGGDRPVVLGSFTPGLGPLRLPPPVAQAPCRIVLRPPVG